MPHWHYRQPPFAFYKTIFDLPETRDLQILLCAEDHQNPVIDLIIERYAPRVSLVTDLDDVIATVLGAKHLVMAKGTFSENLGKMAPATERLYFPLDIYANQGGYADKREISHDASWNKRGYCFEFDEYIDFDGWQASEVQLELMRSLSMDKVHAYALPVQARL